MATVKALKLHAADNVAVCAAAVAPGSVVEVIDPDGARETVTATETISFCNKIALVDLAEGTEIRKYGESIGRMTRAVARGGLVDHRNLASQPRAYADEYLRKGDGR